MLTKSTSLLSLSTLLLSAACGVIKLPGIATGGGSGHAAAATPTAEARPASSVQPAPGPAPTAAAPAPTKSAAAEAAERRQKQLVLFQQRCDDTKAAIGKAGAGLWDDLQNINSPFRLEQRSLGDAEDALTSGWPEYEAAKRAPSRAQFVNDHPEYTALQTCDEQIETQLAEVLFVPKDAYKGKDASVVRDAFAKFARDMKDIGAPVKVALVDQDWSRSQGFDDDGGRYDQGYLNGIVVVQKTAQRGELWRLRARKNWINNGKITFDSAPVFIGPTKLPLGK